MSSKAHLQKRSDGREARQDDLRSRREEEHMWSGTGREASGWELEESRVSGYSTADSFHAHDWMSSLKPMFCEHISYAL